MTVVIPLPSFSQVILMAVLFYMIYYIYWELTVGASRRHIIQDYGCKLIRLFPELETPSNSVVRWKLLSQTLAAYKHHQLLQCSVERFWQLGNTIQTKVLFKHIVMTIELENLKTVLAIKFKDWSLPDVRKESLFRYLVMAFLPPMVQSGSILVNFWDRTSFEARLMILTYLSHMWSIWYKQFLVIIPRLIFRSFFSDWP